MKVYKEIKSIINQVMKNDPIKEQYIFHGIPIDIEWRKGETREYPGSPWKNVMQYDYGYIRGTNSEDGEELDVCIGENPNAEKIYMLMQMDYDKDEFDEFKFMLGFNSPKDAEAKYKKTMQDSMFGCIVGMSIDRFKKTFLKFYQNN